MNYISGAFRYVAGADADKQDEVIRLVERIKSSSLAQDRRGAVIQLTQIAKESPRRQAEIGEIGLKVFYAVLDQDKQYEGNLRAVIDLLIALCASAQLDESANESAKESVTKAENAEREGATEKAKREREAREVAATNIDMFLGLPDAISLVLEHLSHDDFHIRCTTLELLTAMAANSRQTLQAAILDASQGVNSICDLLNDSQQVVRSNTVLLLSVLCTESPEVSKIVAFSGVPDKLFDLIQAVKAKPANLSSVDVTDDEDDNLEAAIIVQDVLELLGSLINCSGTTRTALRELSFVSRIVAVLTQVMHDSGFTSDSTASRSGAGSLQLALLKQNTQNVLLCLSNISGLLQGDPTEAKHMIIDLSATDIFNKLRTLSFLEYVEHDGQQVVVNREVAKVRMAALRTMSTFVKAHVDFRVQFYSSLCPSPRIETATPQICTMHVMLYDRSAALRIAAYVSLRASFILDMSTGVPSPALVNALTGSSSLMSLVQTASADLEVDDEEDPGISIPTKYLAILAEALKDALTLYPKSSDEPAVYYSSALLSWTIIRVPGARERLLASYAHNAGNSLFPQVMRVLGNTQRSQVAPAARIGLLALICSWLYNSPSAVSAFLSSAMHLPMVIDMLDNGTNSGDPSSVHIKGLAAVILGICMEAADGDATAGGEGGFISGGRGPSMVIPRGTISDVIRNHIGITAFTARLDDLKATRQFSQVMRGDGLWQLSSEIASAEAAGEFLAAKGNLGHDEWYDPELVRLIEDVYAQVGARAIGLLPTKTIAHDGSTSSQPAAPSGYPTSQGTELGPSRTMEMLLADSAKDEVLNSYKELIKGQDENLSVAQSKIESLERALREAEGKLTSVESFPDNDVEASGLKRQRAEHMVTSKETGSAQGPSGAMPNGFASDQDRALAVAYLEEQLQVQKEASQSLLDDLDNSRRQQEDWRRRAEESSDLVDQERAEKQKALDQITQLRQSIEMMKSGALAQTDEIAASNRRVSDLEERCAELTEMRKRTEEEVTTLREEVTLRAEQSIEISGKLYEAEERNATLEEARDRLTAALSAAEAGGRNVVPSARHAAATDSVKLETLKTELARSCELNEQLNAKIASLTERTQRYENLQNVNTGLSSELETLKTELARSCELNEQLNTKIASLTERTQRYENLQNVNTGLSSELDEVRASNVELSRKYAVLTESYENLRNGSVARDDFRVLQEQLEASKQALSSIQDENSVLKESVQALENTVASHAAFNVESHVPKRPRHPDATSSVSESFDSHSEFGRQLGVSLLQAVSKTTGNQISHDRIEETKELTISDAHRFEDLQVAITEFSAIAKQSCSELALAQSALQKLDVDRKAMQARIRDLEVEVQELDGQLSATKDAHLERVEELNMEKQRTLAEKESIEVQVRGLKEQLSTARDEHLQRVKELDAEKQRAVDEKESIAAMMYQKEIDVLSSKVAQVEQRHLELLKTKEGLESSLDEMRVSEARLLEDNRQVLELLEREHKKDISKAEEVFNSLQKDLSSLLQEERNKARKLEKDMRAKTEQLAEVTAQLCCNEAAFQATEKALHDETSRTAQLTEDLKSVRATVKQIEESLTEQVTTESRTREDDSCSVRTLETRITSLESELGIAEQKLQRQREAYHSRVRDLEEDITLANKSVEATKRMYEASEASASASSEKAQAVLGAVQTELTSARKDIQHKSKLITSLNEAKAAMARDHKSELLEAKAKLEEASKTIDVVSLERESAQTMVSELSVKVSDLERIRDDLAERTKTLSSKLQGGESLIVQLKARVATSLKESAEIAEELSTKSRLLGEKNLEYQKLADELALERKALSSLRAQHETMSSDKDVLVEENSKLRETLNEALEDLRAKEDKLRVAEQDSLDLRAWVTELEAKAADLQKAAMHFEDVEKNLNDAMVTHKQAVATIAELRSELQAVKSELSNAVTASRTAVRMKDEAEEEVSSQRKRLLEVESRLRDIRNEHTEKLRKVEESMQRSAKRCAELETSLATAERELAEKANLYDQLYASESEKSQLSRSNQSLRVRAEAAEEQLEEMLQQAESLRQELSKSENSASGNAFKSLEAEHNELLVCLAEMEMECASLKQELGRS